jgi:protein SDA1
MLEDEKRSHDDEWQAANQIDFHKFSKKTKKRSREVSRAVKNRKRVQVKKENTEWMDLEASVETCKKLYPAIELLHDAQGLAEAVFQKLTRVNSSLCYEVKLLMMNFVTRLVGNHQLLLLPLYPFLQRYMGGHQRDVTAVLAYSVQACHEYVPPEEVYGILKTITHNFITERVSSSDS